MGFDSGLVLINILRRSVLFFCWSRKFSYCWMTAGSKKCLMLNLEEANASPLQRRHHSHVKLRSHYVMPFSRLLKMLLFLHTHRSNRPDYDVVDLIWHSRLLRQLHPNDPTATSDSYNAASISVELVEICIAVLRILCFHNLLELGRSSS